MGLHQKVGLRFSLQALLSLNLIGSDICNPMLLYNLNNSNNKMYVYYPVLYRRKSYIKLLLEPNKVVRVYSGSIVLDSLTKNNGSLFYINLQNRRSFYQYVLGLFKRRNFNLYRYNFILSNFVVNIFNFYSKFFFKFFYLYTASEAFFFNYFTLSDFFKFFSEGLSDRSSFYHFYEFYFFRSVYLPRNILTSFSNQFFRETTFLCDHLKRSSTESLVFVKKLRLLKFRVFSCFRRLFLVKFSSVVGRSFTYFRQNRNIYERFSIFNMARYRVRLKNRKINRFKKRRSRFLSLRRGRFLFSKYKHNKFSTQNVRFTYKNFLTYILKKKKLFFSNTYFYLFLFPNFGRLLTFYRMKYLTKVVTPYNNGCKNNFYFFNFIRYKVHKSRCSSKRLYFILRGSSAFKKRVRANFLLRYSVNSRLKLGFIFRLFGSNHCVHKYFMLKRFRYAPLVKHQHIVQKRLYIVFAYFIFNKFLCSKYVKYCFYKIFSDFIGGVFFDNKPNVHLNLNEGQPRVLSSLLDFKLINFLRLFLTGAKQQLIRVICFYLFYFYICLKKNFKTSSIFSNFILFNWKQKKHCKRKIFRFGHVCRFRSRQRYNAYNFYVRRHSSRPRNLFKFYKNV